MLLRRRALKRWAWLVLIGFTVSIPVAWSQDCLVTPHARASGEHAAQSAHIPPVNTPGYAAPDDDEHCPTPVDEANNSERVGDSLEFVLGLIGNGNLSFNLSTDSAISTAAFFRVIRPPSLPVYLAALRLRI